MYLAKIVIDQGGPKEMTDERIKALWDKGVQLMAGQYT